MVPGIAGRGIPGLQVVFFTHDSHIDALIIQSPSENGSGT